jgi:hypothetical protein
MDTFIIGYELYMPFQHYKILFDKIESLGTCIHFLDSTWIVKSNLSSYQIRDFLYNFIDTNDKIFVAKITYDAASYGIDTNHINWLNTNLPSES